MSNTWILIDCPNLCHRAFHTTGGLFYEGVPTGVSYGFLRELLRLRSEFLTDNFVFTWDQGPCKRTKLDPDYKRARRNRHASMTDEEKESRFYLAREMRLIRDDYLPRLGYSNILRQKGYEADDVIASVVQRSVPSPDRVIVVSGDRDLFQLLRAEKVVQFNPNTRTTYTSKDLARDFYELCPAQWHCVKMIAGCETDGVAGVRGVGEKTAAKFLRGILKTGKVHDSILQSQNQWLKNQSLVRLPLEGVETFKITPQKYNQKKWRDLFDRLGFKTLKGSL